MIYPSFCVRTFASFSVILSGVIAFSPLSVRAETFNTGSEILQLAMAFEPPAGQGTPAKTAGGASRGQCLRADQAPPVPLTALVPALSTPNTPEPEMKGLTVASVPSFFFYVPAESGKEAAFSLKDENNNDIYQTKLPIEGKSGIVEIQLPADVPPLEIGQTYRWSFGIICEAKTPEQAPEVVFVSGEIQRTEPDSGLKSQLQAAQPLKQAELYAKNGIWFESLHTLAQLRQTQPDDANLARQWEELLGSVGLEVIANQPFMDTLNR